MHLPSRGFSYVLLAALAALFVAACPAVRSPPPVRPAASGESTVLPPARKDGRLPALATPVSYALDLDIDPRSDSFTGTVTIAVDVPAATSHVVLHAHALTIKSAHALTETTASYPAHASTRRAHGAKTEAQEELVLTFDRPLRPGRASLVLSFSAPFDNELSGVYRVTDGGAWYAYSQFEATDARRAFPCFDEPSFKVPFDVALTVPTGMLAVSNTPEAAREHQGAKTRFRFARTLPLPTYLVALAVGDLEIRELPRPTNPPLRLITTKGKAALGTLALETTSSLVDALSTWFGIPYPYEKLDIVAVPDFSAGGMENAGLITFKEELLLLDPARASFASRKSQTRVVAHELAHQWFGDLVTATWWNDLWLNEGFASWMEARIVEQAKPAYGVKNDALLARLSVMDADSLASARAVRQPVVTTGDASEAFDSITYQKGAAVLGTIERWIGEEAFQRGVRTYLTDNAFQSVRTDRLFSALDRASGKDVSQMAATFLDRPGVPEVTAHLECDRGSRWHIELTQERWRPFGTKVPEDQERAWMIPVCVLAQGETQPVCAELAQGAPAVVAGRKCPSWIHPNAHGSYYRFTMPDAELLKLAAARAELDVPARLTLLSNTWAGVRAGKVDAAVLLKVLAAFDDDTSPHGVEAVTAVLTQIDSVLVEDEARPAFRQWVVDRLGKRKNALGWFAKNRDAGDETVRRDVLVAMGEVAEDETTLREAEEIASRWLVDPTAVDSDTASVAVPLAMHRAGIDRIAQLVDIVHHGKTREDRLLALKGLGSFDDRRALEQALDALLKPGIRAPDVPYVLNTGYARRAARTSTEAWVRAHWQQLRAKLPGSLGVRLIGAVGAGCSNAELAKRIAFYEPEAAMIEGAERPLAMAIESSRLCAELRAHSGAKLTRALRGQTRTKR